MNAAPSKLLLIVNRFASVGGAEVQLLHLARGLAADGHRVTVCCVDHSLVPAEALAGTGIEVVELGASKRLRRALALPRIVALARRADVVQCTMWDPSLWGRLAAILARRPVIVADHATDRSVQIAANGVPRGSWIALHNRLLDRFTYATVACAASQRPLLLSEGVAATKLVHIPNGIPISALAAEATASKLDRTGLGLPEGVPLAMQVGVFRPEKNQSGALEAFRLVRDRLGDAELAFVGGGPLETDVKRKAADSGAGAWAHFLGHRDDVAAVLSLADLMLLPSLSDAMPMTVLESMALGVPVIATDVGDVRETLGEAGVCVPVGDSEALARECARLLGDAGLRARMGEAGRRRAAEFDSAKMVRRYEALFAAALGDEPPVAAVAAA